jgi:hypothetical protein
MCNLAFENSRPVHIYVWLRFLLKENHISITGAMPIHWISKQTPDTQISFLTSHSETSMNGDRVFSQKSMRSEFAELMARDLPDGVENRIDMSYFILQLSGHSFDPDVDYDMMMLHSGLKTGARDGKLWCFDDEIKTWHVEIASTHFSVFGRRIQLGKLDFIPSTAVMTQVIMRALAKFNGSSEQVKFIEERRRPPQVVSRPREERSEIANREPQPWTNDSWRAYNLAHPGAEPGNDGVWQVMTCDPPTSRRGGGN